MTPPHRKRVFLWTMHFLREFRRPEFWPPNEKMIKEIHRTRLIRNLAKKPSIKDMYKFLFRPSKLHCFDIVREIDENGKKTRILRWNRELVDIALEKWYAPRRPEIHEVIKAVQRSPGKAHYAERDSVYLDRAD